MLPNMQHLHVATELITTQFGVAANWTFSHVQALTSDQIRISTEIFAVDTFILGRARFVFFFNWRRQSQFNLENEKTHNGSTGWNAPNIHSDEWVNRIRLLFTI